MSDLGIELVNFINYWGEKIESSGMPTWLQWLLIVLIVLVALFQLVQYIWHSMKQAEGKSTELRPSPDLVSKAMTYEMLDEAVKEEKDPKKKAELIKERDQSLEI